MNLAIPHVMLWLFISLLFLRQISSANSKTYDQEKTQRIVDLNYTDGVVMSLMSLSQGFGDENVDLLLLVSSKMKHIVFGAISGILCETVIIFYNNKNAE